MQDFTNIQSSVVVLIKFQSSPSSIYCIYLVMHTLYQIWTPVSLPSLVRCADSTLYNSVITLNFVKK